MWFCIFARAFEADFHNQKEAFAINHKSYKLKILIYVYKSHIKHLELVPTEGSWFFDWHPTRAWFLLVSLSFGSRSLLVRSSFVSRSSLVAYSLVYRRPNEDRTRIKQKTNERRTKEERLSDEKLSKTRRETAQPVGDGSLSSRTRWVMPWRGNVPWSGSFSLSQMSRIELALIMPWPENDGCNPTDEWSKSNPGLFELAKLCMSELCFTEEGANTNDWYGLNS